MKVKKLLTGLVLGLIVALTPMNSMSKEEKEETIVLTANNTVVLNSAVTSTSVGAVIAKAKELNKKSSGFKILKNSSKEPVYLFLNTPGGSIQAGLELVEALSGFDRPTHTITLFAASMGFQLAQQLGDRLILKNGVLMSHRAYGGFEGEFGGQSPSQIDSRYALWKDRLDEMDAQTVKRTKGKQTLESYQQQYSSEMWKTGAKSVAAGYADRIVKVTCDDSLSGTTENSINFFGMQITYELDNCPINTGPMNVKVGFTTTRGVMESTQFISNGGSFGSACLMNNAEGKLCALDTSLNVEKIEDIKNKFKYQFEVNRQKALPMTW